MFSRVLKTVTVKDRDSHDLDLNKAGCEQDTDCKVFKAYYTIPGANYERYLFSLSSQLSFSILLLLT